MDRSIFLRAIMDTACWEVLAGSHYLWGADGGYPSTNGDTRNGLKDRKIELLNINKPDCVAIDTAKYGDNLCHGRLEEVGGFKVTYAKNHLHDCLRESCPEATWSYGLTPRNHDWTTLMVGESCKGKRHFDCIFFVNWVISKALLKKVTYSISQWSNPKIAPVEVIARDHVSSSKVRGGDIFVSTTSKPKHIGFYCEGGDRIHASGADSGVKRSPFKGGYDYVVRLRDDFLKFG